MSGDGTLTASWLGSRPYREMLEEQERMVERRRTGETTDTVLLLEHPPTYTLGRRSESSDRAGLEGGVDAEVVETPRGGRITWHGPGQLVAYPIVDLKGIGPQPDGGSRVDVAGFVASLERAMASSLGAWGVESGPIEGLTGIWTGSDAAELDPSEVASAVASGDLRKIGSIGLRVSRGVTSHGISLNLNCDLTAFERVEACGIEGCRMTSVEAEVGSAPEPAGAAATFHLALARELDLEAVLPDSGPADSIASP
jgi:lipoyl(octanoyl) transferase